MALEEVEDVYISRIEQRKQTDSENVLEKQVLLLNFVFNISIYHYEIKDKQTNNKY